MGVRPVGDIADGDPFAVRPECPWVLGLVHWSGNAAAQVDVLDPDLGAPLIFESKGFADLKVDALEQFAVGAFFESVVNVVFVAVVEGVIEIDQESVGDLVGLLSGDGCRLFKGVKDFQSADFPAGEGSDRATENEQPEGGRGSLSESARQDGDQHGCDAEDDGQQWNGKQWQRSQGREFLKLWQGCRGLGDRPGGTWPLSADDEFLLVAGRSKGDLDLLGSGGKQVPDDAGLLRISGA